MAPDVILSGLARVVFTMPSALLFSALASSSHPPPTPNPPIARGLYRHLRCQYLPITTAALRMPWFRLGFLVLPCLLLPATPTTIGHGSGSLETLLLHPISLSVLLLISGSIKVLSPAMTPLISPPSLRLGFLVVFREINISINVPFTNFLFLFSNLLCSCYLSVRVYCTVSRAILASPLSFQLP